VWVISYSDLKFFIKGINGLSSGIIYNLYVINKKKKIITYIEPMYFKTLEPKSIIRSTCYTINVDRCLKIPTYGLATGRYYYDKQTFYLAKLMNIWFTYNEH